VIAWGWLAAGAPSVLVARWSTARAGERLLAKFHEALREGLSASEALRKGQRAVRAAPETAAPAYWAGWMLLGAQ
jgi:CHAT domain-containing protein